MTRIEIMKLPSLTAKTTPPDFRHNAAGSVGQSNDRCTWWKADDRIRRVFAVLGTALFLLLAAATLNWKSRREMPALERVHGGQSVPCLYQLCKLVCGVFDLTKYFFRVLLGASYYDGNRAVLGPELVMDIRKLTNDLVVVEASRKLGSWIGTCEQRHVKAHSIRAIDERSLRRESRKRLSAVRTLH
jgi:hypothetical protein